ncbi:MAG TPA: prolipoprotein diacylglyceryl transferase [Dehalococcoidia bacterium]|nr:prolipoprotein diacylglyceryl transferase [Dehalococcoidia bacterium]
MIEAILLKIEIGVDPTVFEVAGIEVTWHGVFTALGVIIGVTIAAWLARRMGYPEDMIYNVALALVIGGIIGARGLYVIENWSNFEDDLGEIFSLNAGGISIYGALIGGTIGGLGYAYFAKVPNIPRGLDIGAIGGIMGMAIGRIGDIINGEHFAKATDLPWGVVYTDPDSPAYPLRLEPQHPAVGYELLGDLVIFVALLVIYFRVPRAGVTFFSWVLLYGILRFAVSFLRLDDEVVLGLRTAQVIAVMAIPLGLGGIIYLLRTPPAEERAGRSRRRRVPREDAPAAPEDTSTA